MQIRSTQNTAPSAKAPSAETDAAPEGVFAQLMAQQCAEPDGEAQTCAEGATPASPAGPSRGDETRAARLRNVARQPGTHANKVDAKPAGKSASEAAEADEGDDTAAMESGAAALDPALAHWLAHLHPPAAETSAPATTPFTAAPTSEPGTGQERTPIGTAEAGEATLAADSNAATGRAGSRQIERPGRDVMQAAISQADHRQAERRTDGADADPKAATREELASAAPQAFALPAGLEAASGSVQSANVSAPAPADTTAATVASLPVPVDSPEFAQAFGVQVSVLARDGVHEAELHLNPAEMGPVSVQIALDGERAHIDFGAQAAATRSAIEASLPELAAALRDAGLTLSGGGVSQHTPGRGEAGRQGTPESRSTSREHAPAVAATGTRPAWRGRVSAGGVDLYA